MGPMVPVAASNAQWAVAPAPPSVAVMKTLGAPM